jgi:hypothetical protein
MSEAAAARHATAGKAPALLVFCGRGHRLGMPLEAFHRQLGRISAHIVYLRDFRQFFYIAGVASLGSDYAGSIDRLNQLIHVKLRARSVHCIGNSAGCTVRCKWVWISALDAFFWNQAKQDRQTQVTPRV